MTLFSKFSVEKEGRKEGGEEGREEGRQEGRQEGRKRKEGNGRGKDVKTTKGMKGRS
jgi:hypothetical protein